MNVLSLFDGMSCGQIALDNLGIKVDNYFASEIKKHAIQCTKDNFPNTKHIGDVAKVKGQDLPKIDLLIGGSPCQDFSRANSVRDGLKGMKSMLFYEYIRLLEETKPTYYLLENVIMDDLGYNTISDLLGTEPVRLNGAKVSGALRDRLFWTNIGPESFDLFGNRKCAIPQPKDKKISLNDVLEYGYSDKQKHTCLNTSCGRDANQRHMLHRYATTGMTTIIYKDEKMNVEDGVRYCTQIELERLHNIPQGYTRNLNKAQAGNLIGDGWTVGIVEHIFSFLPNA
ncbi:MAG: DNA (cytosine-5-)-methyltransferase [Ignavibacteriae bacterium]|nr:DNA (cytosine-5-)-methyltransferase [Ignavibacteriota bacterium]